MQDFLFNLILTLLTTGRIGLTSPTENCSDISNVASEASRMFAYDLYYKIATSESLSESGNIFLAPTTITSSLTMLHAGAGGTTRRQIWTGLQMLSTSRRLSDHTAPHCVISVNNPSSASNGHESKDETTVFRTVSRLFGEKTCRFRHSFVNRTRDMGSKMKRMSFTEQPRQSRSRINRWVSRLTNGKIPKLFGPSDITSDTKLAIVSAVYFKAPWLDTFSPDGRHFFTTSDNRQVMADYMMNEAPYQWILSADLQAHLLELPFKTDSEGLIRASMIVIQPTNTMEMLENRLTEQNTYHEISRLLQARPTRIALTMPKFEMSLEYDLIPILREMGMQDMFSEELADLSRMAGSSNGLYVSSVVHKTFIKVDESGCEAAGATGVSISARSRPMYLDINRAFIALIYNKVTETILFIGKINDPTATQ